MSVIKKLQLLKQRKGFTLVEVICAVAIFAMLMVAVFALLDPINKISNAIKDDSRAEAITQTVEGFIAHSVQFADDMELYWMDDADWSSSAFGDAVVDFEKNHRKGDDNPRALLFRSIPAIDSDGDGVPDVNMTFLYSVRLDDDSNFVTVTETDEDTGEPVTYKTLNMGSLENYRVFNRSFYDGVNLVYTMAIDDGNYLLISIDAQRYNPKSEVFELRNAARKESLTVMVNMKMKKDDGSNEPMYVTTTETNSHGDASTDEWTGDYMILYNYKTTE